MINKVVRAEDGSRLMVNIDGVTVSLTSESLTSAFLSSLKQKKTLSDKQGDNVFEGCGYSEDNIKEAIKEFIDWLKEDSNLEKGVITPKAKEIFGNRLVE